MPNFLLLSDCDVFPLPEYKRFGGKGGGGGMSEAQIEAQMRRQEEMMNRQMESQQRFQREAEERLRAERERQREEEYARRQQELVRQRETRINQERQESALFQEMTGQSSEEGSDFGGGFNLAMPTIERPGYEGEDRPV